MLHYLIPIYFLSRAKGKMVDLPEDEDTPEKRVDKIFQKMDKVEAPILFPCSVVSCL